MLPYKWKYLSMSPIIQTRTINDNMETVNMDAYYPFV